MEWVETISEDELAEDERKVFRVGGYSILLICHEGQIYAIESACPHMRLPLKGGKVHDHSITCPWHHSAFDLDSGDVKDWSPWPPAVGRVLGALSREKALAVFPVKVEQGKIWVKVGKE
jgi:nitrite reductase/ring-hydroxylating ferredoxin subunit